MQQIGERKNARQERAIVTWNGFAALAIGLLLAQLIPIKRRSER